MKLFYNNFMVYAICFIAFIIVGVLISKLSTKFLLSYFNKLNDDDANINLTSFELLTFFVKEFQLKIKISEYSTFLNNSYNIKRKTIFLSEDIINNKSIGALTISMHELGHAIQHKNKSKLFYFNYSLIYLNKITSYLSLPALIFLIVSLFLSDFYIKIALIIVLCCYLVNLLIRIFIIPLEKNASKFALKVLKEYNIFNKEEIKKAKKLLNLALLTYVGAFFINYINFFKKVLRGF